MRLPGITIICGKAGYFGVVVCMKEMPRLNASSRRISLKWNTSSFLYFYTRVCRKNRVRVGKTYYREYTGEKYKSQGRPAGRLAKNVSSSSYNNHLGYSYLAGVIDSMGRASGAHFRCKILYSQMVRGDMDTIANFSGPQRSHLIFLLIHRLQKIGIGLGPRKSF